MFWGRKIDKNKYSHNSHIDGIQGETKKKTNATIDKIF